MSAEFGASLEAHVFVEVMKVHIQKASNATLFKRPLESQIERTEEQY